MNHTDIPLDTRHLFHPLDHKLVELLRTLSPEDWQRPTVAKAWKVKDVASHLLDGSLRTLSMQRDRYFGEAMPPIEGYLDLVAWLNQLNADWVEATQRLSPQVLTLLLELTGPMVSDYYVGLNLGQEAIFSVAWAGEDTSYNWMHVAREYTEKWHHQQQIREAVGQPGILNQEFYLPVLQTFFLALPHTFRQVEAPLGTVVSATISAEAGGTWHLTKQEKGWVLTEQPEQEASAKVEIPLDVSWKLFTKSLRPHDVEDQILKTGDTRLAQQVLEMVSVMA
ncbi:MAG TPA: hypothetical protein DCE41_01335 [Cytophagales bacterium]|nr:hypothetical protein [Cytophagales bacterium]HAP65115.1 hypothetical protein [Cytophagales bacterium]